MPEQVHVLLRNREVPGVGELKTYERDGGYRALRRAIEELAPDEVTNMVKASGLRGRGGAGFPTGVKWSFMPKEVRPKYLVANADESEPGTFKDREIMEENPHQFLEGCLLCCYAVGAEVGYVYIRGEMAHGARVLEQAIEEARQAGYLGRNILGSDTSIELYVHRGAGAYICGEETAMLESLEGKLGQPRVRPPFPAQKGVFAQPTVVNNVETLANVPPIVRDGPDAWRRYGTEKSPGTKVYSLSGHVQRPGNYELPLGTTFRELIFEHGGGLWNGGGNRGGNRGGIKAVLPAGASAPILVEEHLDVAMDFESVQAAGSMLGSGSIIVIDRDTCIVWAATKMSQFFKHESCGKCTPCREGTHWLTTLMQRVEGGEGTEADLQRLDMVATQIQGKCLCALGEFATSPVLSTLKYYRDEYEHHVRHGRCPFGAQTLTLAAGAARP